MDKPTVPTGPNASPRPEESGSEQDFGATGVFQAVNIPEAVVEPLPGFGADPDVQGNRAPGGVTQQPMLGAKGPRGARGAQGWARWGGGDEFAGIAGPDSDGVRRDIPQFREGACRWVWRKGQRRLHGAVAHPGRRFAHAGRRFKGEARGGDAACG